MILGIGIDLCRIARIRRSVDRLGDAWTEEVFTNAERDRCRAEPDSGLAFARAFACKEACAKALGTGFAKGVRPPDIILKASGGEATIQLEGKALKRLKRLTPRGQAALCHVTVAVADEFLTCTVIIDAN